MTYIFSREYDFFITHAPDLEVAKQNLRDRYCVSSAEFSDMEVTELQDGETKLIQHSNE